MSWHGGWQAQRSSSGARATSLEAAVAPIRESACSLDVGLVPAALQRVVGLRPPLGAIPSAAATRDSVPVRGTGVPGTEEARSRCSHEKASISTPARQHNHTSPKGEV